MDQRCEPRFEAHQTIALTDLGKDGQRQMAHVENVSGRGLGLTVPRYLPEGTALKIELEDYIILGEVMYCRRSRGQYFLGIQLEQVLSGMKKAAWARPAVWAEVQEGSVTIP